MIKIPPYLKNGDAIGIVCPAGYMEADKIQTCMHTLQDWGYKVVAGKTVNSQSENYFSGTDEERLEDLQQMMDDKNIKAIMCARGGYGTSRIIDDINFKKFKKHPKWIIGFSDITVLHAHLFSTLGIASIHAPMAAAFNDNGVENKYVQSLRQVLKGEKSHFEAAAHQYNRLGKAKGRLVGGNLSLLVHAIGTPSDVNTKNKILFLEDIGEQLYSTDRMLQQLKRSGKLDKLAGLIFGGFTDTKDTDRPFGKSIDDILKDAVAGYDYPVCYHFPVSHETENYALKMGVPYTLKVTADKVILND